MNYVNIVVLPRPYNVEFKCIGGLIFDINYMEPATFMQFTGMGWRNSKGQFHRENGPAIIRNSGYQRWCRYGKYHREDGPATIWSDGSQHWWLNDIYYSEEDFHEEMRKKHELRKSKNLTKTL